MNFWSKGLGEKTIDLYLGKGEAQKGVDRLYVKGRMEAPVSWEYIMCLRGEDLADFFALLSDPAMADYVYHSPDRWRLIGKMVVGGLRVGGLVLVAGLRQAFGAGLPGPDVELELPPPSEKKRKRAVGRRLGSRRLSRSKTVDEEASSDRGSGSRSSFRWNHQSQNIPGANPISRYWRNCTRTPPRRGDEPRYPMASDQYRRTAIPQRIPRGLRP